MNNSLSPRERQIVELLLLDLRNYEIAERLGIKNGTVRTLLDRAMLKTATRSRLGLAIWGTRNLSAEKRTRLDRHDGATGCGKLTA